MTSTPVANNSTDFANAAGYLSYPVSQQTNPADGAQLQNIIQFNSFVPTYFDYVSCSPATNPTSIVYKTGGSVGTTVCTLTITYSGSDISSVTRT